MGLFDKKYCSICGEKIGLFGNRKLEDGNLCKNCEAKLSPFFSDRRKSTVEEIRTQLEYRQRNMDAVAAFHITRALGDRTKVLLDEDAGKFMVTSARSLATANPDVLDFADVTGCRVDLDESRTERMQEDKDGNEISYKPPHFDFSYSFYVIITVHHPYFNEIRFPLNSEPIEIEDVQLANSLVRIDPHRDVNFCKYEKLGREIKEALTNIRTTVREEAVAAAAPKASMTCPYCGAVVVPDEKGCCEFCGSVIQA